MQRLASFFNLGIEIAVGVMDEQIPSADLQSGRKAQLDIHSSIPILVHRDCVTSRKAYAESISLVSFSAKLECICTIIQVCSDIMGTP